MPKGRTMKYAIWRACERFGMLPPNVNRDWVANTSRTQSELLGYSQIRDVEDAERCVSPL
jgi:hypothetical protein